MYPDDYSLKTLEDIFISLPELISFVVGVFCLVSLILFLIYASVLWVVDKKKIKYIMNERIESDLMMWGVVYPPNWFMLILWIIGVIAWIFILLWH